MIADIDAMLERKGWSRADLGRAVGIDAPQISNILNGKQGLSIERLLNFYRVLGMAMLVREGDPLHPVRLGTISGTGRLMADFKDISFPGYVEIGPRAIGPYGPGMQVWLKASNDFAPGRWVLVARDDGHDLVRCDQRGDTRVLVTSSGDSLMYEPERHSIVAVSYGRFIRNSETHYF